MAGRMGSLLVRHASRGGARVWQQHGPGAAVFQHANGWPRNDAQRSRGMSQEVQVGSGSGGRIGGVAVQTPPDNIPFAVKGLNHVAIAVPDLRAAAEHYRTVFGAHVSDPIDIHKHGVTIVFVRMENLAIELLHPLGDSSPVKTFLEKNPRGGLHHICLTVNDLGSAMEHAKSAGVGMLWDKPKLGAHHFPVNFVDPKSNHGVLCELEEVHVHYEATREENEA